MTKAKVADEDLPGGLAYFEWCADEGADSHDVDAIAQANPALGTRLGLGFINGVERDELTDEELLVERLGLWHEDDVVIDRVIPEEDWASHLWPKSQPSDGVAIAIDVSPDGRSASIGISDGAHIEVIDHRPGTSWLPTRLVGLLAEHELGEVVVDPRGPAGAILVDVADAGVDLSHVTGSEYAEACGAFLVAVLSPRNAKNLRRIEQPILDAAVAGAVRRPINDAWVWSRRKTAVDISPLVAVTLARWAALVAEVLGEPDVY